jgi:UDP-N-acetylmuramoyl-tripeptide--D-alanyl-D-alanine ligase
MLVADLYELFIRCDQNISTDTRNILPRCIFFALRGDTFNGNLFAAQALANGAAFAVVDDTNIAASDNRMVLVADVLDALQQLSKHHRIALGTMLIGLTGSNGKTTSKELMYAVLSRRFNTLATIGNLNNHIGVPLTLLRLRKEHEIGVIEMGANHQGEIETLSILADPDIGVITNIGKAHIGTMGGLQGIIKTKCELYDHVRMRKGLVLVPSSQSVLLEKSAGVHRLIYGTQGHEDIVGELGVNDQGFIRFRWRTKDTVPTEWVSTNLVGAYNLDNCLAAVALGTYLGLDPSEINAAISGYSPTNHRSQQVRKGDVTYIMDAYNANPSSMTEALQSLAERPGKRGFVLGEMLELGEYAEAEHSAIVEMAMRMGPSLAVFVGDGFRECVSSMPGVNWVADAAGAKAVLDQIELRDMTILIKGSRKNRLELLLNQDSGH